MHYDAIKSLKSAFIDRIIFYKAAEIFQEIEENNRNLEQVKYLDTSDTENSVDFMLELLMVDLS